MPKKKADLPSETPGVETANPALEADVQEIPSAPSDPPQPEAPALTALEPESPSLPIVPEEESVATENMVPLEPAAALMDEAMKNRKAVVCAKAGLNLRAGPGPGFKAHTVLPDGAEVSVLTLLAEGGPQGSFDVRIPGWKYVFTGQMVGWVDSRFLDGVDND